MQQKTIYKPRRAQRLAFIVSFFLSFIHPHCGAESANTIGVKTTKTFEGSALSGSNIFGYWNGRLLIKNDTAIKLYDPSQREFEAVFEYKRKCEAFTYQQLNHKLHIWSNCQASPIMHKFDLAQGTTHKEIKGEKNSIPFGDGTGHFDPISGRFTVPISATKRSIVDITVPKRTFRPLDAQQLGNALYVLQHAQAEPEVFNPFTPIKVLKANISPKKSTETLLEFPALKTNVMNQYGLTSLEWQVIHWDMGKTKGVIHLVFQVIGTQQTGIAKNKSIQGLLYTVYYPNNGNFHCFLNTNPGQKTIAFYEEKTYAIDQSRDNTLIIRELAAPEG
jgi:hypothetical protein